MSTLFYYPETNELLELMLFGAAGHWYTLDGYSYLPLATSQYMKLKHILVGIL